MASYVNQFNISGLPEEILPEILKFLSTRERKAAKLVCRLWFETCNRLSSNEVLKCFGIYSITDTYELLSKSERRFLNLKFDFVTFYEYEDSSFWEDNGSRIRSIVFKDCRFPSGIDKIIVSCENLIHLSFVYICDLPHECRSYFQLFNNFDKLLKNGIVRENLNSLKIHFDCQTFIFLSDKIMCQLFSIFPKLRVLKIFSFGNFKYNFKTLGDLRTDHSDPSKVSSKRFTFAPVLNYLIRRKDHIEKLQLYFPVSSSPEPHSAGSVRCILDVLAAMNRLTKLSLNLGYLQQQGDVDRLLNLKQLKSFKFEEFSWTALESLFSSNSRLEHLSTISIDSSIVTRPLLEKLMSSGLKSCKISFNNEGLAHDPDSFRSEFSVQRSTPFPNLSVDIGRWRWRPSEPRVEMVNFLNYAKNILHLQLDNASYQELQALLKYQRKLRSLIMRENCGYRTSLPADCVDIFKNAFYQLTELEHVELGYSMAYLFLNSVSPRFGVLAKLKYLKINGSSCKDNEILIYSSDLLRLTDATPYLEGLYVSYGQPVPVDVFVELCSKLSRLQFLRWDVNEILDDEFYSDENNYPKLFAICPSLRVICHCIDLEWYNSRASNVYFFDTINKKIMQSDFMPLDFSPLIDQNVFHAFAEPRIARHTVDWLKF